MKNPERLLVLGATGHIGQAVVRRALAQGQSVTAATRQAEPIALRGLNVSVARVDQDLDSLADLAKGHDLIVDAAAPYPLEPCLACTEAWRSSVGFAVRHAERVIDAALRQRIPLAFVSSFTTLPRVESPLRAMEAAWRRSVYPYFEAKAAMEQEVIRAADRGLSAVVVNPAACLGPWESRGTSGSFVGLVLARQLPVVMDHTINVVDVRDIAIAIERAVAGQWFGRPIPLAGNNTTLAALAVQVAALAGEAVPVPFTIDARVAAAASFWTGATFAAFGRSAPDPMRAIPLIADAFPMQPSPEQLCLGVQVRPLAETLADSLAFHRGLDVV